MKLIKGNKIIGVVSQMDENIEDPELKDIHKVGTVAKILRVLKMPDGNTTIILQGQKRFEVNEIITLNPLYDRSYKRGSRSKTRLLKMKNLK